jgi:hypothetical protein
MKLPGIFFFCFLSFAVSAYEDLGPLNTAKERHPEIFIPGSICKIKIAGKESYVFSGQAEQLFSKKNAETDSELYQEAESAAKSFFYQKLSNGNERISITMSQCQLLYRFHEQKTYTVILFVPVENVSVTMREENVESGPPPDKNAESSSGRGDFPSSSAEVEKTDVPTQGKADSAAVAEKTDVPEPGKDDGAAEAEKTDVPEPAKESSVEEKNAALEDAGKDASTLERESSAGADSSDAKAESSSASGNDSVRTATANGKDASGDDSVGTLQEEEPTIDETYQDILNTKKEIDEVIDSLLK